MLLKVSRGGACDEASRLAECPIAITIENRQSELRSNCEIDFAVAIEIADRDHARSASEVGFACSECSIAVHHELALP